jgi:hypothetical protein
LILLHQYKEEQDVGFYLHQEGPNLGKTSSPISRYHLSKIHSSLPPTLRYVGFYTDIKDLSQINEILDRIQDLAISSSVYDKIGLKADVREIYVPPTTHLVATVDDLTDVLDYSSEEPATCELHWDFPRRGREMQYNGDKYFPQ